MVRCAISLVVIGALGGCDVAVGTASFDPIPPLCGPFGMPSPVQFDPLLDHPTDFSVAGDGMSGLVTATYNNTAGATPIILVDGVWRPEVGKLGGNVLASSISGGHMGVTGDVYAWLDHAKNLNFPILVRYAFTTVWSQSIPDVAESNVLDLTTGNEVESDAGNGAKTRYVVELAQDFGGTMPHLLAILAALPASDTFKPTNFADPLNAIDGIDPTGAALTGDHEILVYSAKLGSTESHLFETASSKFQFAAGNLIQSLYVPGKADDQPWINADCSQIWFRRGGVTLTAQRL